MYCVYKHVSPEGKQYFGITSQNPEIRWQNGLGYRNNHRFFKDIVKYGWDNFLHSILHSGLTQNEAEEIEAQLISDNNTTNPLYGYNLIGDNIYSQSRPVAQYSLKGEYIYTFDSAAEASRHVNTTPNVISRAARVRGVSHNYLWKYIDDETPLEIPTDIEKRTRSTYGKTFRRGTNKLSVSQYDFAGNLIATYSSITEASKTTGINATCISGCCKGDNSTAKIKRYSAGGYVWKYS